MRLLSIVFVGIFLTAGFVRAEKKPNILFIAIDDQNDWVGCLGGHPQVKTPHIDSVAARGTVFLNAHCQSPLCNPSRTSLLLGLRPSTTGVYGLAPWFRNVPGLKEKVPLPKYLEKNGYRTFSTGKIYHGEYGRGKKDTEFQELGPPATPGPFPPERLVKDTPQPHKLVDWGTFPHKDEDKGDWKMASWAVNKLDELGKEDQAESDPFFLSVGFFLPHVPCFATQKWFDLYPEETVELPPFLATDRDDTPRFSWYLHWKLPEVRQKFLVERNEWKNLVRSYMACTSFVDSQVGRLVESLKKNGLEEDTIIVIWGDHGWHLGEKLITGKNSLWDDGTRVPLIFAGPGVSANGRCTKPAELLDVYPSLVELCGLPKKDGLEGLSLVPQLKDASAPRVRPAITTHNHDNHGIRSENYRYIRYADGSEEFYDHTKDPNEWTNVVNDPAYADEIAEHRKWLPTVNLKPAPGSASRILTYDPDGETVWEGKAIGKDEPVPEI